MFLENVAVIDGKILMLDGTWKSLPGSKLTASECERSLKESFDKAKAEAPTKFFTETFINERRQTKIKLIAAVLSNSSLTLSKKLTYSEIDCIIESVTELTNRIYEKI